MSRTGDELLAVVSAQQKLSWKTFRDAFDVLHARALHARTGVDDGIGYVRLRTLRLFTELGHAEVLPFGSSPALCAAPTVLAALPAAGLPRACLCGSRSLSAGAALREAAAGFGSQARVVARSQPFSGGYAPAAIHLETTNARLLAEVADTTGIPFISVPPAWQLLRQAGSLAEYEARLQWDAGPDPAWPRRDFDPATLTFRTSASATSDRLSSFHDPVSRRQIHRLWSSGRPAGVDRDWGRWLYLHKLGIRVLLFDEATQTVAVPATVPLPAILGRALSLLSGLAPARQASSDHGRAVDVYAGVGADVALLLAAKLGTALNVDSEKRWQAYA